VDSFRSHSISTTVFPANLGSHWTRFAKATVMRLLATPSLLSSAPTCRAYLARNRPGPADSLPSCFPSFLSLTLLSPHVPSLCLHMPLLSHTLLLSPPSIKYLSSLFLLPYPSLSICGSCYLSINGVKCRQILSSIPLGRLAGQGLATTLVSRFCGVGDVQAGTT
jgi:hypothetical protein